MTPEHKAARAVALMADELFISLMDELEASAIDVAIYAKASEHDKRQAALCEAKAVRDLKAKLEALARNAKSTFKAAPA